MGVLVAAGFLQFYQIGVEAYWLDEIHTLANSAGQRGALEAMPHGVVLSGIPRFADLTPNSSPASVWRGMADDTHPPLYFVLVNIWRGWFGDGEAAVRSLSAVFSLFSMLIVAGAVVGPWRGGRLYRRSESREGPRMVPAASSGSYGSVIEHGAAVLLAVLVVGLSYVDVYAGQQARPYAMGMFFVVGATVLLIVLGYQPDTRRRILGALLVVVYAFCLLGAMLTHYFAALPLLGHGVYVLVRFRGAVLMRWLVACVGAGLAWSLLWGPMFLDQLPAITNQPWLSEDRSDHLIRTVMRMTDMPMRLLFAYEPFSFNVSRSIAGGALIAVLVWLLRPSNRGGRPRGISLLFGSMFAVPVVAFLLVDVLGDRQMLAHLRYVYFAWPGLVGMVVAAVDRLAPRSRWIAVGTFVVGCALTLRLPTQDTPDVRSAAVWIEEAARPGDLLVYDAVSWPAHWASRMYAEISYYLDDVDVPFVMLRDPAGAELLEAMKAFSRLIVVCPRPGDVANPLPEVFDVVSMRSGYIDQVGWVYLLERSRG